MAALNYLKTQIRDIKSIYRVTKAMELLSIVRMRQVESKVLASQVFFKEIYHTFQEIVSYVIDSPYKVKKNQQQKPKTIWIVVNSDMGLCGGYNLNVNHLVLEQIQPDDWCFLIGKKGRTFFQNKKIKFYKTIAGPNISFSYDQAQIIANDVLSLFHTGQVTCIQLVYSHYINQMTIQPVSLTLLPITDQNQQKTTLKTPLEFEPHPSAVLKAILPFYLNATIFGAVTEAMLCEQIARRVAMDGATRNADKISKNLITQYNKTRQQAITQEIIEIISGATYTNN